MGTYYILKGDLEKAREYFQSARMLRRQMRDINKNNLPQIHAKRTMPDGTVIKAQDVYGKSQMVIDVPVGVVQQEAPKEIRIGQNIGGAYQRLVPAIDVDSGVYKDYLGYVMCKAGNRQFIGGYIAYSPYVENQGAERLWHLTEQPVDRELLIRRGEAYSMGAEGSGAMNNSFLLYRELEPIGYYSTTLEGSSTVSGLNIRVSETPYYHYIVDQVHTVTKWITFFDNNAYVPIGPIIVGPFTYSYRYREDSYRVMWNFDYYFGWYEYSNYSGINITHTFEGFGTEDFERWGLLYALNDMAGKYLYSWWDIYGGGTVSAFTMGNWYVQVDGGPPHALDTADFETMGARQQFVPNLYKYDDGDGEKTIMTWFWNPWYNTTEYPLEARYKNNWCGLTQWDQNNVTLFPTETNEYYAKIDDLEINDVQVWIARQTRVFEETTIETGALHTGPLGGTNIDLPFPARIGG